jgi:large subunit ribosomal protein L23
MINQVIIRPIVTEKAMKAAEGGKYSFIVAVQASKTDIKREIGSRYKVNVIDVQTIITKGRTKRSGTRRIDTTQPKIKKAYVKLKKGEKIGIFEPGGAPTGGEEVKETKKKK